MDYEVLMLSRIHEEWERTGDNTLAVANGLQKTGGLITGAAAIMVVMLASLVPQSLHGFMGPIGFVLLFLLARMGRRARDARNEGEKFAHHALKHGRAADLIVVLAFLHAFLGFLYIFTVL